ncbi:MAG: tRNA 4-thiouridine(8) synthase ThiI, partial [Syntrophomonadaceae bacterium]|nr:tRNA 4-thiouridine(8) synthase ThiI [Syntrophomonadaceae bacterium]
EMKALSLFSGGLDSQLAVCLIKDQGIEVMGVNFTTPFFGAEAKVQEAADNLDIPLKSVHLADEYMMILRQPRYGFGKNMNACIDCHGLMQRKILALLPELEASFVISGEVVGQRPMSQTRQSLGLVDKLGGPGSELIVRPLSARLLPPSKPEEMGWVNRERLLDISGRSRKIQMELADQYGLKDYPTPAGGCLLTQENFSRRLRRYLDDHPESTIIDLEALKYGRHFYLEDGSLLIVGRHQADNQALSAHALPRDLFMKAAERPGPLAILRSPAPPKPELAAYAAAIVARYSDAKDLPEVAVKTWVTGSAGQILRVRPLTPAEIPPTY